MDEVIDKDLREEYREHEVELAKHFQDLLGLQERIGVLEKVAVPRMEYDKKHAFIDHELMLVKMSQNSIKYENEKI